MKIKKIYLLFSLVASALYFTSCKNDLNVAPDGRITMDQVFSDKDKVGAFLNTCYDNLPVKGNRYFFWTRGPVEWSDEAWDADELSVNWVGSARLYDGNASAADHPINWVSGASWDSYYWSKYFTNIRNCTIFLERIKTSTANFDKPEDEMARNRWIAEAHLLRAFYYAELLKWYGCGLPL
ncbi:MAG: RagB/SusD family nutrient uptake outer membrane protein, partial [Bacteroidota bacterium]|nr:RagB/SusD family nutrient uptake outer membrane protein [Bacteroidota bacterium]